MAEEKSEELLKKENEAVQSVLDYFELSKLLFCGDESCPYEINELKPESKFYKKAKAIADELEISWKKMSHEDSNRIMLALLEETYLKINVDNGYMPVLSVTLRDKKQPQKS